MIVEKQKQSDVLIEGSVTQESIAMTFDLNSVQYLMQMLSKDIYSDAIGSAIRETASNALDSHRFAKVDAPIIVSFKPNKEGNYEFSVQDFGRGLDDIDVRNIISKYGASTKRADNEALGMFGQNLGCL